MKEVVNICTDMVQLMCHHLLPTDLNKKRKKKKRKRKKTKTKKMKKVKVRMMRLVFMMTTTDVMREVMVTDTPQQVARNVNEDEDNVNGRPGCVHTGNFDSDGNAKKTKMAKKVVGKFQT